MRAGVRAREKSIVFPKVFCTDSHARNGNRMSVTYYVVPNNAGYGDWSIIRSGGSKVADAQTQGTAVNRLRSSGSPGTKGDRVVVYGSRSNRIVDNFVLDG